MPGKHNAGGCGCCGCTFCTDLYARVWAFSLCGFSSGHAIVTQLLSAFDNLSFSFPSSAVSQLYSLSGGGSGTIQVIGACVSPTWSTETYNLEEINPSTGVPTGTYQDIEFSTPSLVINFIQQTIACDPVFHWYLNFTCKISGGSVTCDCGLIGNQIFSGLSWNPVINATHCKLPYACPYLVYDSTNTLVDCTNDLSTSGAMTGTAGVQIGTDANTANCTTIRAFRNPIASSTCTLEYTSAPSGGTASTVVCI